MLLESHILRIKRADSPFYALTIGDDVLIAGGCRLSDYSGHPLDPEKRIAGMQVDPEDVRPVRIEDKAWLGRGCWIFPGVTIGEGAVIGAAAVVTREVPPGRICVGNPGRLLSRTVFEPRLGKYPKETDCGDSKCKAESVAQ